MIVVGWLVFAGGYALVYYGISMWRYYTQADVNTKGTSTNPDGIPFPVLLGLNPAIKMGTGTSIPNAHPPFNLGGSVYGQTAHTSALQSPTGTSAQGPVTQL